MCGMTPDFGHLAEAIRLACAGRGWSQEDLIRESGVGRSTVQRLWAGRAGVMPNRTTRAQLERALGWAAGSVDDVLAGGEPTALSAKSGHESPNSHAPEASGERGERGLPIAVQAALNRGETFDTDIIDLSRPGESFELIVIAKAGTYDAMRDKELMRARTEQWMRIRKELRDLVAEVDDASAETNGSEG